MSRSHTTCHVNKSVAYHKTYSWRVDHLSQFVAGGAAPTRDMAREAAREAKERFLNQEDR